MARDVVDGFTGRTAVKAGQHAKQEIKRVSQERQRDLDAVLSE